MVKPAPGNRVTGSRLTSLSNLDAFLLWTAPCVDVSDEDACFSLRSLWNHFEEPAAYGATLPLCVSGATQVLKQVYTPSLSAIRLFAADAQSYRDARELYTSSDEDRLEAMSTDSGSSSCCGVGSDSEDGKWGPCLGTAAARLARGRPQRAGSAPGPAPQLLFEFEEAASPHVREPLTERVAQLAEGFPGLHTLRSADLHPSSYLAVAWYPLYALNKAPNARRDLNACFLTFHSLGSAAPAAHSADVEAAFAHRRRADGASVACLPAFAFVPYKMQGRLWAEDERSAGAHAAMVDAALQLHAAAKLRHSDLAFFLQNSALLRKEASHF